MGATPDYNMHQRPMHGPSQLPTNVPQQAPGAYAPIAQVSSHQTGPGPQQSPLLMLLQALSQPPKTEVAKK